MEPPQTLNLVLVFHDVFTEGATWTAKFIALIFAVFFPFLLFILIPRVLGRLGTKPFSTNLKQKHMIREFNHGTIGVAHLRSLISASISVVMRFLFHLCFVSIESFYCLVTFMWIPIGNPSFKNFVRCIVFSDARRGTCHGRIPAKVPGWRSSKRHLLLKAVQAYGIAHVDGQ